MPRSAVCPAQYLPQLVLHCCGPAHTPRLTSFISEEPFWPHDAPEGFVCNVIPNDRYPHLILLKTSHPIPLLRALWSHHIVLRYIAAIFPVDGVASCLDDVWVQAGTSLKTAGPLRVHVHPNVHKARVMGCVLNEVGADLNPKEFRHVFMLLEAYGRWYYGLLPREHWYLSEATVQCDRQKQNNVCSAHWKINEVFQRQRITLSAGFCALDIGASPGGWTHFLGDLDDSCLKPQAPPPDGPASDARGAVQVVAVDPAALAIDLPSLRYRTVHYATQLQNAIPDLSGHAPFDIVVMDANLDVRLAARLILSVVHLMRPDCWLVLTLKLGKPGLASLLSHKATEALQPYFADIRLVWLLSNSKCERTLVARRRVQVPRVPSDLPLDAESEVGEASTVPGPSADSSEVVK